VGWCRYPVRNTAVTTANPSKVILDFLSLPKQNVVVVTNVSFQSLSSSLLKNIDVMYQILSEQ
jgi:hypothetical protein